VPKRAPAGSGAAQETSDRQAFAAGLLQFCHVEGAASAGHFDGVCRAAQDLSGRSATCRPDVSPPDLYRFAAQLAECAGIGIKGANRPVHFQCVSLPIDLRLGLDDLVRVGDADSGLRRSRQFAALDARQRFNDAAPTQFRQFVVQRPGGIFRQQLNGP
jgi:hypothetical protein